MKKVNSPKEIEHLVGKKVKIKIATGDIFDAVYFGENDENPNDVKCDFETDVVFFELEPGSFEIEEI